MAMLLRLGFQLKNDSLQFTNGNEAARVDVWINSSECSARTGKFLVTCNDDSTFNPVDSVSIADDRGHNLILNLYSVTTRNAASTLTLVRLNMLINWLGVLSLAVLLIVSGFQKIGIVWMIIWSVLGFMWRIHGPDVYSISLGLSCFSIILVILAHMCVDANSKWLFLRYLILAVLISVICNLMREAIGMIAIIASLMTALATLISRFSWRRCTYFFLLTLFLLPTFRTPTKLILNARNSAYSISPSEFISSHGLSHTLYLGLGAVPNPWGIIWDDGFADREVKKVNPCPFGERV